MESIRKIISYFWMLILGYRNIDVPKYNGEA